VRGIAGVTRWSPLFLELTRRFTTDLAKPDSRGARPATIKKGAAGAIREALPPSPLRSHAGSAAATAPRTAAGSPSVRLGRPWGSGRGAASPALCFDVFRHVDQHLGRAQIGTRRFVDRVTIASRLVIVRRRPSIVTTTVSFCAAAGNAGRVLVPRPPRLPDCPFLKRWAPAACLGPPGNRSRCPPYAASSSLRSLHL
jgi:hypothetical protein